MAKRLIFSDLHFGDPCCTLYEQTVAEGLKSFLTELGPIEELILAGDVLDGNISSLTTAIWGRKGAGSWPEQIGFQGWLDHLLADKTVKVDRIIYVPGNHDYIVWNILSTDRAFVEPISKGEIPTDLPLTAAVFPQPFIRGVAPLDFRNRFIVVYPDYSFDLPDRKVLVTHGHYLDDKQTLFKDLEKLIRQEKGNTEKAVRDFFIRTAQYQAVASAVSYVKGTRGAVDKIHKGISRICDIFGSTRNQPIDAEMLKAMDMYLCYFRHQSPDIFVFGHTHEAGHVNTFDFDNKAGDWLLGKAVDVWNDGAFLKSSVKERAGTFVVADDDNGLKPVRLYQVDLHGAVTEGGV
jgi:UDP-2,3-diacylglucosamine pyrophosphatase LpxH